jgi:hypothetical protein
MKYYVAVFLFLCSAFTYGIPSESDYNITIHVSTSRMVFAPDSIAHYQYLTVIIDGKKYELQSLGAPNTLLMLGNYKAKIVRNSHGAGEYESWRVYEILFPNQKTREFVVVGQSE